MPTRRTDATGSSGPDSIGWGRLLGDAFRLAGLGGIAAPALPQDHASRAASPSAPRPDIPKRVDVAIVGGGVIGLFTALTLARRGVSVALFEKGRIGGEQSTRNWGWCRQYGRDPSELPLAAKSLRLWQAGEWHPGGVSPFRQCGIVYLARTDVQAERYATYLEKHKPGPLMARALSKAEVAELLPGGLDGWASALYLPTDGRADPDLTVSHLVTAAGRAGAGIFAHCAARGFETTAGRVSGLITEFGRITCDSVVVAAGVWSSTFCRRHGVRLPQVKVVSSALATEPVDAAPTHCVFGDGFAFGRQRDGSYLIGHGGAAELPIGPDVFRFAGHYLGGLRKEWRFVKSYVRIRLDTLAIGDWRDASRFGRASTFERRRTLDPPPALSILDDALDRLRRAFPVFAQTRVRRRWAGAMDVTPDALPVISHAPAVPGLVIGTGFSGQGFGLAPGAGEVLADLATGRDPDIDITPFRLARFHNGARPLPGSRF